MSNLKVGLGITCDGATGNIAVTGVCTATTFSGVSAGKVGIGTDTPHVTGLSIYGANSRFQLTSPTTGGTSSDGVIFGLNGDQDFFINNRESSKNILFFTENTEEVRIQSAGGISFNGDTATANALDDYEEGSFTAAAYEGGSAITLNYHNTHGRYTKVGNMVTVWMWVRASGTTTSTGGLQIGGLPFASNADSYRPALVGRAYGLANFSSKSGVAFWMNGSSSVIEVVSIDSNGLAESSNTSNNVWTSGAELHCTFSYFV